MLDQPARRSRRPPRADHVEVDVGAVSGDHIAKVLLVSGVKLARSYRASPWLASDHSSTPVISSPSTNTWGDLQVAVREHKCPWPERSLGDPVVARDQVGGQGHRSCHLHSPSRCDAISSRLRPGHGGSGALCSMRAAAPATAHPADDAVDGSPRRPSAVPGGAASASTGGFRHRTCGVGIGARAIASTATSVRV